MEPTTLPLGTFYCLYGLYTCGFVRLERAYQVFGTVARTGIFGTLGFFLSSQFYSLFIIGNYFLVFILLLLFREMTSFPFGIEGCNQYAMSHNWQLALVDLLAFFSHLNEISFGETKKF